MINYPYSSAHTEEHKKLALYFRKNIDRSLEHKTQNRFLVSLLQEEFLKHIDYQDRQIETFYYENN